MIFSWNCSVRTHAHFILPFPQFTTQCVKRVLQSLLFQCENLTFRDLPVVGESSTQRDGDGRQVSHGVAEAVHPAVSSRAERLWGKTGAVEARVGDAPHRRTTVATVYENGPPIIA